MLELIIRRKDLIRSVYTSKAIEVSKTFEV